MKRKLFIAATSLHQAHRHQLNGVAGGEEGQRRGRGRQGHRNPIRRGDRRRGGAVVYGPHLPTREELNQIRREERNTQLRVRAFIYNIYFRIL